MKDLHFPDDKDISLIPSCPHTHNSDAQKMSIQVQLYSTGGSRDPNIGKLFFCNVHPEI